MNNLHRELAPISDSAWAQIEEETSRTLKRYLAGRRVGARPAWLLFGLGDEVARADQQKCADGSRQGTSASGAALPALLSGKGRRGILWSVLAAWGMSSGVSRGM